MRLYSTWAATKLYQSKHPTLESPRAASGCEFSVSTVYPHVRQHPPSPSITASKIVLGWNSLVAQQVKDLALSLQVLLWLGFIPGPRNFHMTQVQPKKKKKKSLAPSAGYKRRSISTLSKDTFLGKANLSFIKLTLLWHKKLQILLSVVRFYKECLLF